MSQRVAPPFHIPENPRTRPPASLLKELTATGTCDRRGLFHDDDDDDDNNNDLHPEMIHYPSFEHEE